MTKFQFELLKEACPTRADEVCRSFSYSYLGSNSKQNQKMLCLEHASQEKLRGQEIRLFIVPGIFILQQIPSCFSSTRSELPERDCTSGGQVSSVVVIVINGSTASSLTSFSSALLLAPAGVTAPLEMIVDGCWVEDINAGFPIWWGFWWFFLSMSSLPVFFQHINHNQRIFSTLHSWTTCRRGYGYSHQLGTTEFE